MFDDDPRWGSDPRERDDDARDRDPVDPRDAFVDKLDLPRGLERELVRDRDREYTLRGSESRTLSLVGSFRVVSSRDLSDHDGRPLDPRKGDLRHLREQGLVRTIPIEGRRDVAVVLTDRGRDLLESHRRDRDGRSPGRGPSLRDSRQEFYAELKKPRELEHDVQVYPAYEREAARLQERGARIERVVLDYELKREYQQFLQERNRGRADSDGRPDRGREPFWLLDIPRVERANGRLALRSGLRGGPVPMTAETASRPSSSSGSPSVRHGSW